MSAVATTSLKLGAAEIERLRAGALEYGTILDDTALGRCAAYAALLDRWRTSTNLISCRTATELVERHLLDALACAWPCAAAESIADLGSGAGLPGVPLAIVAPERRIVLVEPRRRRASFLRAVRRDLALRRVEILAMRAEDALASVAPVDVALCRAVWPDDATMTDVVAPWVRVGGLLLCMRSEAAPRPASSSGPLAYEESCHYLVGEVRRRFDVFRRSG